MICPDCNCDNIAGADVCEGCGASLTHGEEFTNALERGIIAHSVDVLCAKQPVCVPTSTSVREAIDLMMKHQTGAVLVETNGELAGIFTERDVLNEVGQDVSQMEEGVGHHMTASPETITKKRFHRLCHACHGRRRISASAGRRLRRHTHRHYLRPRYHAVPLRPICPFSRRRVDPPGFDFLLARNCSKISLHLFLTSKH